MSIWTHSNEVIRLLNSPEGTGIWWKYPTLPVEWTLTTSPDWDNNLIYIVNDKHAEIRKQWVDKGKPQVQIWNDTFSKWDDYNGDEPEWYLNNEYRIKPNEWETPEGEDAIAYHAKRLNKDWEEDWYNDNQAKWYITHHPKTEKYDYHCNYHSKIMNVVYMSRKSVEMIVEALNNKKLKLKDNK